MEQWLKRIGEQVARRRKEKNIKQGKLAKLCDTDAANISRIENGHVNATILTLKNICDKLEVPVSEVLKQ